MTEQEEISDRMELIEDSSYEDEAEIFLGLNPSNQKPKEILLREDLADRIKIWMRSGLNKEDKGNILSSIPKKGQLNLKAPCLNEEIAVDLHPRALSRDEHFKDYRNLSGAALSAISSVLSMILENKEHPLDRNLILKNLSNAVKLLSDLFFLLTQARKTFLLGKFEDKIQKILRKIEPTDYLFGDNLKSVIETSRAVEKASRELKPKTRTPLRQGNNLIWKSSSVKKDLGRGSYKSHQSGSTTWRISSTFTRNKTHLAKSYYTQSQPQRNRR